MAAELDLVIVAAVSLAAGAVNDDCVGHRAGCAWVIDGATDLVERPFVGETSDAAWLAGTIDQWLMANAHDLPADLADVTCDITADLAARFLALSGRQPAGRHEHPSAAGLIVRIAGNNLDYVSLADCTLLIDGQDARVVRIGDGEETSDPRLCEFFRAQRDRASDESAADMRRRLRPLAVKARADMNLVPGYAVFSITMPPQEYVLSGRLSVAAGTRIVLASDGFMRLVDVYGAYSPSGLLEQLFRDGGADRLLRQLREIERDDRECRRYPRLKASDDASVVAARVAERA